ncbi:IS21 family transposase [Arenimonas daejeonensis]|uniref:IS21 family transposase n=1 Tax=Arenimonas daejeonensis TaxID=370777 RepID=UPI0011BEFA36|nr:IS21 family transposase [Arenimonas daejeonensis]
MATTDLEIRMTIKTLAAKGLPRRAIARQLDLSEGTVRYHLARQAAGALDGRAHQPRHALVAADAIAHWMAHHDRSNLAALHAWLAAEHGYTGSLRSVQRFVADRYPPPPRRARRRVETPPGAQAQVDWAQFPRMVVAGQAVTLHAFHLVLSHSRFGAVVWMPAQDSLCWLAAHNAAFERVGGIPAVLRVDNTKTAVVRGAGAWGQLNDSYRRYATTVRFHVDACAPYSPEHKGKVERAVRTHRGVDLARQAWDSVDQLQAATDDALRDSARRRRCPATGSSVFDAWQAERPALAPLPILPAPFDHVATRRVGRDGLVAFEGRQYSVPFAYLDRPVEVRGAAGCVQVLADQQIIAQHPRHTDCRVLLDPAHYEGPSTATVQAPTPLGRMGRRLQELAAMPVQHRPLDLYAALAEVAR